MSEELGRKPYDPGFSRASARAAVCGAGWKPLEIAAMVFGFALYWPLGVAVIGFKFWQKRSGYQGDLFSFGREKWESASNWRFSGSARGFAERGWRSAGFGSSGNRAFDEWRDGELARLEEERRKLVAAEREFTEFMETLRRARDREEFDRFMQERHSRDNTTSV
ncbi:DUF2852 domain-containing protein [Methylocella silvestris]|uniref:DUF2852 domain-containing protein n=1 Tax=Methylocella silvestris TaxID=199596 RepID=UPI00017252B3|nr:DUF2852 domain-containing protein [Methylocella silvestris]